MKNCNINSIHVLRGLACLIVVYSHWFMIFFDPGNNSLAAALSFSPEISIPYTPWFIRIWKYAPLLNFGMLGVCIFYLISGFLIPFSMRGSCYTFLKKRFLRVIPLHTIGVIFTYTFLMINAQYYGIAFPYRLSTLFKNITLTRLWFWVPNIAGVSHTLESEVFFYLICAVLMYYGFNCLGDRIILFISLIGFSVIYLTHGLLINLPSDYFYLYKLFYCLDFYLLNTMIILVGTSCYHLYSREWSVRKTLCVILLQLFLIAWSFYLFYPESANSYRFSYGIGFLVFLLSLLCEKHLMNTPPLQRIVLTPLEFISDISFPLYVTHGAAGYAVLAFIYPWTQSISLTLLISGALFLAFSTALHYFIEIPIQSFSKTREAMIHGGSDEQQ